MTVLLNILPFLFLAITMLLVINYNATSTPEKVLNYMVMNDYNYLEVYLFEKNERTPAYLMSFPKRYGIRQLEASNQRLLIKPTKDIPMVEEVLLRSLFKDEPTRWTKIVYLWYGWNGSIPLCRMTWEKEQITSDVQGIE